MSAIILDTETTGIKEPQVIELGFMEIDRLRSSDPLLEEIQVMRFKPTKAIELGARATHHILYEDLVSCSEWPGAWLPPDGTEYVVGHAIDFDWAAIGKPHVARICTLALARAMWPEFDSHSLGALTYAFMPPREARELLRGAHGAGRDVELCHHVLVQLLKELPRIGSWHDLWLASEQARVPVYMTFGKYGPDSDFAKKNGGPIPCRDVFEYDRSYFHWLFDKCDQVRDDPYLQKALRAGVRHIA